MKKLIFVSKLLSIEHVNRTLSNVDFRFHFFLCKRQVITINILVRSKLKQQSIEWTTIDFYIEANRSQTK